MIPTLYEHQIKMIDECRQAMLNGHKSILLQLPTGGGKSIVAAEFIRRSLIKDKKSLFIVPRRELVRQMDVTFNNFGISHSFVCAGHSFNPFSNVHVGTVGSLPKRIDKVNPDIVFVDEAHICGGQLEGIIDHYKSKGSWIIGMSATPKRLDGKGLGRYYSHMVKGPSLGWLIKNGYLSKYVLFAPDDPQLTHKDFIRKGELEDRMEKDRVLVGNAINHYKKYAIGKLAIVYTMSRKHSEIIVEQAKLSGIRAMAVDGNTPDAERKRIIKMFAMRELDWIVNCELFTYGFDLSSAANMDVTVECIIDLQPTESLSKQWQKNGRGMRKKDYPALLFDHSGNMKRLGYMPHADIPWTLNDDDKKSRSASERTIQVMQCEFCHFCAKPFNICPNPLCGRQRTIKNRTVDEIEGELREIKAIEIQEKKTANMEVGMARTLADLRKIADERGYAKGWVYQKAKAKNIKK